VVSGQRGGRHQGILKNMPWIYGALLVICLFHVAATVIWLLRDNSFLWGQTSAHLSEHIRLWYTLERVASLPLAWHYKLLILYHRLRMNNFSWSPFIHLVGCAGNVVMGRGWMPVLLTSSLWFIVLISSTCALGCRLFGRKQGLLAAVLVSLYPGLYGLSRNFGPDLPLASLVTLGMYALVRSQGFKRGGASLAFGLCLGMAMLVKLTAAIFFLAPVLMLMRKGERVWHRHTARRNFLSGKMLQSYLSRQRHVFQAVFLAVFLALAWWHVCFDKLPRLFVMQCLNSENYAISYLDRVIYFAREILTNSSLLLFCAGVVASVLVMLRQRRIPWLVVGWFALPLLIGSCLPLREGSYVLPCLPALALLTARGVGVARGYGIRSLVVLGIVGAGVFQFFHVSFGWGPDIFLMNTPELRLVYAHPPVRQDVAAQVQALTRSLPRFGLEQAMIIGPDVFLGDATVGIEYGLANVVFKQTFALSRPITANYFPDFFPWHRDMTPYAADYQQQCLPRYLVIRESLPTEIIAHQYRLERSLPSDGMLPRLLLFEKWLPEAKH